MRADNLNQLWSAWATPALRTWNFAGRLKAWSGCGSGDPFSSVHSCSEASIYRDDFLDTMSAERGGPQWFRAEISSGRGRPSTPKCDSLQESSRVDCRIGRKAWHWFG